MTIATAPPRLVLLDGHGLIVRAFFAQRDNPLSVRRTGLPVYASDAGT